MKTNELMVGDFIRTIYAQKIIKVREIKQSCIYTDDNGYEYNEIEPIPLTLEILEKNGFERNWQDNFVYDNEDIGLIITFHPKETNYTNGTYDYIDIERGCVTITEMPIEFVHQLQHVLRLCEVSIEIIEL